MLWSRRSSCHEEHWSPQRLRRSACWSPRLVPRWPANHDLFNLGRSMNQTWRQSATLVAALFVIFAMLPAASSQEVRPGVWAARELQTLPLPATGYQAYLVGEWHGLEENPEFQSQYLAQLHKI